MTTTTETAFVWGTTSTKLLAAIDELLPGFTLQATHPLGDDAPKLPKRARPVPVARKGKWFAIATDRLGSLEGCGAQLSRSLGRSVLTVATSTKGVVATRWKAGLAVGELRSADETYRGPAGETRLPAKVLWPWLPKLGRRKIVRDGIAASSGLLRTVGAPEQSPWIARPSLLLIYAPA